MLSHRCYRINEERLPDSCMLIHTEAVIPVVNGRQQELVDEVSRLANLTAISERDSAKEASL